MAAPVIVADGPGGSSTPQSETLVRRRKTWVDRLFAGEESYANSPDKIVILQNGVEIEDVPIDPLGSWTVVGRHPRAHIQLEASKLGLFHAAFHKKDGRFYLRAIDLECGTLLDRKKIKAGVPVPLRDGSLVDIPGYQLRIRLANSPASAGEEIVEAEELAEKIRAKVAALGGCEQIVLNPLNWGMEQLELLAGEVLPRVAKP